MSRRMNYSKARPKRAPDHNVKSDLLEREADRILHGHSKRKAMRREHDFGGRFIRSSPEKEGAFERAYFRSVGSVMHADGKWHVHDGSGEKVADYPTRWQAWQHADKYGMERAGELG